MRQARRLFLIIGMFLLCTLALWIAGGAGEAAAPVEKAFFPRSLESYGDQYMTGIIEILWYRAQEEPFNLWRPR